jgi:5-methylcytosine-specific restriction endonuclease McrBC regulatory subunit McrC
VIRQFHSPSVIRDALTGETYSSVIPDVRLFQPDGAGYCIDAKYKLYDQSKISNADIYQLFLYAFAYASENSQRCSVLIFPSESNEPIKHRLSIRCGDGSVGWVTGIGVHIPAVIDEIESNSESTIKQAILEALVSD